MQVKAGARDLMLGIIYRPPNQTNEFFSTFPKLLEKGLVRFSNIVLLGDFNSNLQQDGNGPISYEGKMAKIFEQYNIQNIIEGPTRIINHSKTLIDLIVSTRKDPVKQKGTCPLGISAHATSVPRDPLKIITIRNYNKFDEREFQNDIDRAPFQVCEVFENPSDAYHAWNLLFTEICDKHAPFKQIKIRQLALDNKGDHNDHEPKVQGT